MERANFRRALQAFVARRPFKPFRVELASGAQFTVDHPEVLDHRGAVAVFIDESGPHRRLTIGIAGLELDTPYGRQSATRKLTNSRAAAESCSPRRVRMPE